MTDWTIRPAAAPDAPALALIGAATFLETFAGVLSGADIVAHCTRQHAAEVYGGWAAAGASMWLAEAASGAAPVGYAVVTKPELPLAGIGTGDVELKRIYTLSRFHGSGLGGALMTAAIERAKADGQHRLLLGVYKNNERAIAFYRKQGFTPVGERHFRVGATEYEDQILALPLS